MERVSLTFSWAQIWLLACQYNNIQKFNPRITRHLHSGAGVRQQSECSFQRIRQWMLSLLHCLGDGENVLHQLGKCCRVRFWLNEKFNFWDYDASLCHNSTIYSYDIIILSILPLIIEINLWHWFLKFLPSLTVQSLRQRTFGPAVRQSWPGCARGIVYT